MSTGSCCFTGHRIIPKADRASLTTDLRCTLEVLITGGVSDFICGGALGFDTLAAEEVLLMRRRFPKVRLHLLLPCRDQDRLWNAEQRKTYARILESADSKTFLFDRYVKGCMQMRNRAMVDESRVCIAYYTGRAGGTAYTVHYAKEQGVRILYVPTKGEPNWKD